MYLSYFDEWLIKPFIQGSYFIYSLDLILEMNVINQSQSGSKRSKKLNPTHLYEYLFPYFDFGNNTLKKGY